MEKNQKKSVEMVIHDCKYYKWTITKVIGSLLGDSIWTGKKPVTPSVID